MVTIKQEKNDNESQPNREVNGDEDDGIQLAVMKKRLPKKRGDKQYKIRQQRITCKKNEIQRKLKDLHEETKGQDMETHDN
ncbi:hypothetical protein AQUCO_05500096v1 [Aquilegia coerulea]|uniref:Uncharacterized protein n=1 Tax=Aquilegia coerulea TaxID=218851 RepID=A0A2G5CGX2_AQUCA|nr:hypothetical protein AQUCO_05500096v1 [Aquilegia coerulea]